MLVRLALLLLLLAVPRLAWAAPGTPYATELITVSNVAIGVTDTLCRVGQSAQGSPTGALLEVVTNSINYTLHSSTATPDTTSYSLSAGDQIELSSDALLKFRAVRKGGSDATVRVSCFDRISDTVARKLPAAGGVASSVQITDGVDSALVSGTGSLQVTCDNCGGSTFADNSAFTFNTTPVLITGYVFDDVAPNAVTENRAAAPRMSGNRVPYAILRDAAGNERGANVNASNQLSVSVDNALTVTANQGGAPWTVKPDGTVWTLTGTSANANVTNTVAENLTQIAGNAVSTVASGVQKVGIADSAGTAFLSAANALNSTGGGIQAAQIVGQFDDTAPTAITENQFGNLRMSANRNLYGTIRDAGGNERGANVTAGNAVQADLTSVAGNTTLTGNGVTGTGSARVTIASDNSNAAGIGGSATGSAVPSAARYIAGNGSGNLTGIVVCDNWTAISQTTGTQIITGTSAKKTYICSINIVTATAQNIALVAGTGTVCATGTSGIAGGTTAATGWNFAANTGLAQGTGVGAIMRANTNADNVCILQSGAGQVSGAITWTQF